MSAEELTELEKQLDALLEHEFTRPSSSPWGRPVIIIKKRDTDADHRPSKANKDHALRVADLFHQIAGATVFSKMDLGPGYHQIRTRWEDIPSTSLTTQYGSYEYTPAEKLW